MNQENEFKMTFEVTDPVYFEKEVAKINNRANRMGIGGISFTKGGIAYREQAIVDFWHPERGKQKRTLKVTTYEVTGSTPKLEGWEVMATIKFTGPEKDKPVLNIVPGREIPESYREATSFCEHCNTMRKRAKVVIMKHEGGRWIQVGSTCVKDFFHGRTIEQAVNSITFFETIYSQMLEASFGTGPKFRPQPVEGVLDWLEATSETLHHRNYLSRKKAAELQERFQKIYFCTDDTVSTYFWQLREFRNTGKKPEGFEMMEISAEAREEAKEVLEWIKTSPASSDYMHNLKQITAEELFEMRFSGYLTSAVAAFRKDQNRRVEIEKKGANSVHQGQIKERITRTVTVETKRSFETDYGTSHLLVMVDESGNYYKWFASSDVLEEGETAKLKATVKAHDNFNGIAQTVLTRGTVLESLGVSEDNKNS